MAQKKKIPNRWAGREEFVNDDVKRLRHMSAEEIKAYYDQVEPVADGEVQEIFDRVMPKISYEIATIEQKKRPRHTRSKIGKIILVAACIILMISVVAQALGVPVWETIVIWTNDCMDINIRSTKPLYIEGKEVSAYNSKSDVWGENVYALLDEIGIYPALPTYIPKGFEQHDLYYAMPEDGDVCLQIHLRNMDNQYVKLFMDLYSVGNFVHGLGIEYDVQQSKEMVIDDVTYYFVSNITNDSVVWSDEHGTYCMYGNVDEEVLENMIRSINRR